MSFAIDLAERGLVPDWLIRRGIRQLLSQRLRHEAQLGVEELSEVHRRFVRELRQSPIALHTEAANAQHYEVPSAYYELVLGPHRKYSSCLWHDGVNDLERAEAAMLDLTCQRAQLCDGQEVLELGCGWGSLSLWMADQYRSSRILAVSNSHSQREFIQRTAEQRGLTNLQVETADINHFSTTRTFDRVVSVEMFEHLRNFERLFANIDRWLRAGGKLFTHVFYHVGCAYPFEVDGNNDWMAKHFFTGGIMPSADLFLEFQRDLLWEDRWLINGRNYQKTLECWLARHDAARNRILSLFEASGGPKQASLMFHRWRIFYMACAELFGYQSGNQWGVAHFLFRKRAAS